MTSTSVESGTNLEPFAHDVVPPAPEESRRRRKEVQRERTALSQADWRRPWVRLGWRGAHVGLLLLLLVWGLGPLLLLAKFAVTPTADVLSNPMAFFPNGVAWSNLTEAWTDVEVSKYFVNTVVIAAGAWFVQLLIATTGGYVISILRPRYAKLLYALVLTGLFVPSVVLLVPLYLTVLDVPIVHTSLIDSYWAVWLPAGASAFNVVLVARFFDALPREVFEAARVDGAGTFRLFWSVVLPMSKPILGVTSVFAIIASWKDFLWPLLVIRNPDRQPLSVRLPSLAATTDMGVLLAALAISTIIPIIVFLCFQRLFLGSGGLSGAVKG